MKIPFLLLLCIFIINVTWAEPPKCYDKTEECHSTNYETYVHCVRRRNKRSVDCNSSCNSGNCVDTCDSCDCTSCNYKYCENSCNTCCSSCCNNYIPCRTNYCCHKTCHAQCRSTDCRNVCRKNCFGIVKKADDKDVPSSNTNSSSVNYSDIRHNVTTIIHLNNIVNHTNIIDVPITINNTNIQNITLQNEGGSSWQGGSNSSEKCCVVISPRRCVPTNESPYIRCFHYRTKQCGAFCTASIMHRENQQVCQSPFPGVPPSCQQRIIYIPQPQPRCSYQSVWPYVSCGIQRPTNCYGCYNHYVNENSQSYLNCPSGCYDDGFGVGPYYRQGPFYRPSYYHAPCYPCFGYSGFGGAGYGYGGYQVPYGYGFQGAGFGGFGGGYPEGPGYPASGGYPVGGGYPPLAFPYGSWSPGEVTSFGGNNATTNATAFNDGSFDPIISVGPGVQYQYLDPYRAAGEVEIDVNYEPSSAAQAEVKIKPDTINNDEPAVTTSVDEVDTATTIHS